MSNQDNRVLDDSNNVGLDDSNNVGLDDSNNVGLDDSNNVGLDDSNNVGLDDKTEDYFSFKTTDNIFIKINKKTKIMSSYMNAIDECKEEELILINLNSTDLTFIKTYLEHHINNVDIKYREKAISNIFSENVSNQFDIDFIENKIMKDPLIAKKQLYAVLNAADYLHIEKLIQLICLKIATMIKCISLEKIKTILDPTTPYYKS
jgi:hypothetical protein